MYLTTNINNFGLSMYGYVLLQGILIYVVLMFLQDQLVTLSLIHSVQKHILSKQFWKMNLSHSSSNSNSSSSSSNSVIRWIIASQVSWEAHLYHLIYRFVYS
jgi:hypothetical protein